MVGPPSSPGLLDWIQWLTAPSVLLALPTLIGLTIYFVVRSRRKQVPPPPPHQP